MEQQDLPIYLVPEFAMGCEFRFQELEEENHYSILSSGREFLNPFVEKKPDGEKSKNPLRLYRQLSFHFQNEGLVVIEDFNKENFSHNGLMNFAIKFRRSDFGNFEAFSSQFPGTNVIPIDFRDFLNGKQVNFTKPPYKTKIPKETRLFHFSPFPNPFRIPKANGRSGPLTAGTYLTSESESLHCTSGFAVVGRFALPSNASAHFRHQIILEEDIDVLVGTVLPNFGFCGGGVEIFTLQPINKYRWGMQEIPIF